VLSNVGCNHLAVLRIGVGEDVLDEVVSVLVAGNVNEWNTRTVCTTLANSIQISAQKVNTTNLQALLNYLGGKLVSTVFRGIADDMINGTAAISWSTMFANVLNAPIAELTMGDNVNASENFFDAWALRLVSNRQGTD